MPPRFLLAGQRPAAMPLAPSSAQHHIRRPDHGCCLSLSVPQPVQTRSSRAAVDSTWTPIPSPLPEPSSPNPHSACGTLAAHLSRVPSLEAFGHRPPACAAPFVTGRHPKPFTRTVLGVTPAERQLTLRIRTKSLQRGSRQFRANGRNRYRDSPLRGGASLIALRLGRASIAGGAEPSITVAAARSSSTVQHELRCFSQSQRSPAFTCREVGSLSCRRRPCQDALPVAVVRCTSAIRALLAFSGGHHSAHNFLVKWTCCHFAQVIGVTSDPRITFP